MKITNTDSTRFSSEGDDSTHRRCCCRCFSSKRKQHQNPGEVKREKVRERAWHQTERWHLYSSALWDGALLSGLSGCQAEAKVHHRSATKTADVKHLAFPSLSFSAFTHAHSPGLSASTLDLISLSPLCCYGNQNLGITSLQLCDGSCGPILQPLLAVSPPEGGNKDLSHIQDLNFSLVRRRDEPRLAFTH